METEIREQHDLRGWGAEACAFEFYRRGGSVSDHPQELQQNCSFLSQVPWPKVAVILSEGNNDNATLWGKAD